MNYLITGITGFSGPHLAKTLIKNGHTVYGLHRNFDDKHLDIKDVLNEDIDRIKFIQCDLTNIKKIYEIFETIPIDGVFHLGAYTHPALSFENPEKVFNINTAGTMSICEAIRKFRPNCVMMHCSTAEVYGVYPENIFIKENFALQPISPYAVSKAAADIFVQERLRNEMIKGFIVRPFSHTGPRRRKNYCLSSDAIQIARIIKGKQLPVIKVGNLEAERAIMDVRDVVNTYYTLMLNIQNNIITSGQILNMGSIIPHKIGYYVQKMLELYNLNNIKTEPDPKLFRKIDLPLQLPDCTKINTLINWKLNYSEEDALKSLVDYWIKNEENDI